MKYRILGREKKLSFGKYPEVSLKKARDDERKARKPGPKVYEVTLENVDKPGLPLPPPATNTVAHVGGDATEDVAPPVPSTDAGLDESERILEDYVTLLSRSNRVALTH